jgi:hypothetical protein
MTGIPSPRHAIVLGTPKGNRGDLVPELQATARSRTVIAIGETAHTLPPFWSTRLVIDFLLDRMQIS